MYERFGKGEKVLFAFHGFGQDRSIFRSWERKLGKIYTLYAFDLFNHGESSDSRQNLSKRTWKLHIDQVLKKNGIDKFSVLGYSLGGRFALSTALSFPKQIEEIILIAPDGIFLTLWFKLATTPGIRFVFKYMMENPDRLEKWIQYNDKVKIVNKYVSDFIRKELNSKENRSRVYISWNHFKTLGYKRRILIKKFQELTFKKSIILGSKDHIIRPVDILPIVDQMGGFEINVLKKKHHQLLDRDVAELIAEKSILEK